MVVRFVGSFIGAVLGLLVACIAIDPNANLCAIGEAQCACTVGGACDPGLECVDEICVDPAATTSGDPSTTDDDTDDATDPGTSSMTDPTDPTTDPTTEPGTSDTGPQPSMPNFAFVTSQTFTGGQIGGLMGADSKCQDAANAAGLPGMYRAWLSVADNHAFDRLGDASGWIRPDDRPFAADSQQIVNGTFFYPPNIDENGVLTNGAVWTGTFVGAAEPAGSNFCGDWMSDDGGSVGLTGELGYGADIWSSYNTLPCSSQAHLVCLGVDQQFDLEPPPLEGRLAFVSTGILAPNAGRAAADAMCQQEATDAGHDGEFLALLGVAGETPAARFDTAGPPWVRYDGVRIFPDDDPFSVWLDAPILFDANGAISPLIISWAGAFDVLQVGSDATSCTSWSATNGYAAMFNVLAIYWLGYTLDGGQANGGTPECTLAGWSVICLET